MKQRERWNSRIGLILAMAGNAIGLGNFLRFPVQAAENGGGAFMIPYFISFIVLGIPLMWVEWGMGRYGGSLGHGTAPGVFDAMWKNRFAKYFGILGIFLPLVVLVYYTYIASWTLAFSLSSLLNYFPEPTAVAGGAGGVGGVGATPKEYLAPYLEYFGNYVAHSTSDSGIFMAPHPLAYPLFLLTLGLSLLVLVKGISEGIEKLCKVAIPALFVMATILFVRIVTLDSPTDPTMTTARAFSFLWEPDLSGLTNPRVWLAAAGQVFFTLSLGMGAMITYASYVKKDDDIALTGLATASLNEFAEVVFGSTIVIASAVIFFGVAGAEETAADLGAFKLGMVSMPAIFAHMPAGNFFGFLWFGLLYIAALTSIVALSQPAIAFFEDEFDWSREKAVKWLGVFFVVSVTIPMFVQNGLDELDFWVASFSLVILALAEMIIFFWVFGAENAWNEITRGGRIKVPRVFFYLMKYVSPVFLSIILIAWLYFELYAKITVGDTGTWIARGYLVALFALHIVLVEMAWQRRRNKG